jgi:hypothetical protein
VDKKRRIYNQAEIFISAEAGFKPADVINVWDLKGSRGKLL